LPNIAGLYLIIFGVALSVISSIPFKRTNKKHANGYCFLFNTNNESELEIKFNGRVDQQIRLEIRNSRADENPGSGILEKKDKINANSTFKHKLESNHCYTINAYADYPNNDKLFYYNYGMDYSLNEYKPLSERYFQFFLTLIPVGVVIYYSSP